jgi:hypothetical protein
MPTQHKFWRNDKTMEFSDLSRFGLMCAVLTESRGAELLTLFLAGFPVKTFPAQEKAQDLKESEADCGQSLPGLLAKYDLDTHSLRTAQCSLFGDLTECYVTLPRWGLMRDGALYLPPTVALPMREKESGLWLTPRATDTGAGEKQETFLARMGDRTDKCAQSLPAQVNNPKTWPTPTVCGNHNKKGLSANSGDGLSTAVKKWPTPTAHNAKETNAPSESERNTPTLAAQAGGALNPMWVEWLMGWPIGWTDLKPLETDKCRYVQQQHSEFYQASEGSL